MFETFFEDHICCFDRLLIISSTELGFNAENKSRQRMTKPLLFEDFSEIFDYMTFYFALRKNEGKRGMKLCKFKTIKFSHTSIIFSYQNVCPLSEQLFYQAKISFSFRQDMSKFQKTELHSGHFADIPTPSLITPILMFSKNYWNLHEDDLYSIHANGFKS